MKRIEGPLADRVERARVVPTRCDSSEAARPRSELRLGYLIVESRWGRGYATELLQGLVEWVRIAPFRRIVAGVASDNVASKRVLEKSGFVRHGEANGIEEFYVIEL